jgi:hypothetical protein
MPALPPVLDGPPNREVPEHWLQVPTRSRFTALALAGAAACAGCPHAAGVSSTPLPGLTVVGVTRVVVEVTSGMVVVGVGDEVGVGGAVCVVGVTSEVVGGVVGSVVGPPGRWVTVPAEDAR